MLNRIILTRHLIVRSKKDRLKFWIAWHLPHWLVYMCGIRLWANATTGEFNKEEAPALLIDTAIHRWENKEGGDPKFR